MEESICWFCRIEKNCQGCFFEMDFHKVLERKAQFVVFGTQYKQRYLTRKVQVPLCKGCHKRHQRTSLVWLAIWFVLGIIGSYYYFTNAEIGSESLIVAALGAIVAVVLIFFTANLIIATLQASLNLFIETDQSKAMKYLEVKRLLNEGWKDGDKPNYKWSS